MTPPLRFFALGDWGREGSPEQRAVAAAMSREARRARPAFVVSTGDNFYEDGVASPDDPLFRRSFEAVYRDPALAGVPWHPVLGNHDHRGSAEAQVAYSARSDRWRMPARRYVQRYPVGPGAEARFVFLDTTPLLDRYAPDGREPTPHAWAYDVDAEWAWIERTLASPDGPPAAWTVVVGHHPVFSGSPFHGGAPELHARLRPLLERHADLYLCGHEHDLQHLEAAGVHYVVAGGGSECRETGALGETRFHAGRSGFLVADLDADAMRLSLRDDAGGTLHAWTVERARQRAAA